MSGRYFKGGKEEEDEDDIGHTGKRCGVKLKGIMVKLQNKLGLLFDGI